MRIFVVAITFAVTMAGLFLFENYKTPSQEPNYAKIVDEIQQAATPTPSLPTVKSPTKTRQPIKQSPTASVVTSSPIPTPTPIIHAYYTSSASQAKYYYCDTDSAWKNLSKANLKQFSSPEELLKPYPSRILHEPCNN